MKDGRLTAPRRIVIRAQQQSLIGTPGLQRRNRTSDVDVLPELGLSLDVECHAHRRTGIVLALSLGNTEALGAPRNGHGAVTSVERGDSASIRPRQIDGAERGAGALVVLLREAAVGRSVFLHDGDEGVGVGLDGAGETGEFGGGGVVRSFRDGGGEEAEEGKGEGGDGQGFLLGPDGESIIELFRDGESAEVPGLDIEWDQLN
jgi:hypothetical protein